MPFRTVVINENYQSPQLQAFLDNIDVNFSHGGRLLYQGRNTVKVYKVDGRELVIKKFATCSWLRALGYLFVTPKSKRAYLYGLQINKRGIKTPESIAYIQTYRGALLRNAYYISEPDYSRDMTHLRRPDFDETAAAALAQYLVRMHRAGLLHGDLNLTNVLRADDGSFRLIDTNRSKILPEGKMPSQTQIEQNLMRLTHRRDLMKVILKHYALNAGIQDRVSFTCNVLKRVLKMEARKHFLHALKNKFKRNK